jgi:hypothetical protein
MEPRVTERDVALLMLSEESLLTLGAVLAFQARAALGERGSVEPSPPEVLPA